MRIVHVITRLLKAGAEENTLATCIYQANEGDQVYLLFGDEFDVSLVDEAESNGITCIEIPCMVHPINPASDSRAILALREYIAKIQPDILHTHQSKAGILARLASVGKNTTVIHTVHIVPFENTSAFRKWMYIASEWLCAKFTDQFIDVSSGTRDTYLKYSIGKLNNHEVVYSGMAVEKFSKFRNTGDRRRKSNTFRVVMMAAFQARKRHEELIVSIESVLKKNPEIELQFLGQGDTETQIKVLVRDLGLEKQVKFLGYVNDPENYIKEADLGVLVSEREGLPRVLVQFMATGVPVVSTWLPGIEEIVQNNINGIVQNKNDIDAVTNQIEELALNSESLNRLKIGALNTDVRGWNLSAMGPRIHGVYSKAIQRRTGIREFHSV